MVSSTLCPAVHILGSQNVYGRAEGVADHYWPWAVFSTSSTLCPLGSQSVYRGAEGIADHYWPWAVFLSSFLI